MTKDLVNSEWNEGETNLPSSTDYKTLIYMSSARYPKKKLERNPHNTLKELSLRLSRT
jgi:hypothetical protein